MKWLLFLVVLCTVQADTLQASASEVAAPEVAELPNKATGERGSWIKQNEMLIISIAALGALSPFIGIIFYFRWRVILAVPCIMVLLVWTCLCDVCFCCRFRSRAKEQKQEIERERGEVDLSEAEVTAFIGKSGQDGSHRMHSCLDKHDMVSAIPAQVSRSPGSKPRAHAHSDSHGSEATSPTSTPSRVSSSRGSHNDHARLVRVPASEDATSLFGKKMLKQPVAVISCHSQKVSKKERASLYREVPASPRLEA